MQHIFSHQNQSHHCSQVITYSQHRPGGLLSYLHKVFTARGTAGGAKGGERAGRRKQTSNRWWWRHCWQRTVIFTFIIVVFLRVLDRSDKCDPEVVHCVLDLCKNLLFGVPLDILLPNLDQIIPFLDTCNLYTTVSYPCMPNPTIARLSCSTPITSTGALPCKARPYPSPSFLVSCTVLGGDQQCLAENTDSGPSMWNRSVTGWPEKSG